MTIQDMAVSLAARDAGMQSSAEHAEEVMPGWQDRALEELRGFANGYGSQCPFTMEEWRMSAEAFGLPQPAELRAYGALTVRAIREGIIEKTGQYAPAASSNGSAKPLYRRKS